MPHAGLRDLVSMTVYLTDPRFMDRFLSIRQEILAGNLATSTMICIDKLYEPEMMVEISAVARSRFRQWNPRMNLPLQ